MGFNRALNKPLLIYMFFLVVAIGGFYQVAWMQYSLQWDMLDGYLPTRYFVTDCIQNQILPLWNPYMQFGFPQYGFLSTVMAPETLLIGLFGRFDMYMLHFVYIFYISLCGFAMYKLASYFNISKLFSICAGISLMFSGFIVSEGQDMPSASGVAFICLALLQYIKMFEKGTLINMLKSVLFVFLVITHAYPGLTIIFAYTLLAIGFYYLVQFRYWKINFSNGALIKVSVLTILILMLSSFHIASYWYTREDVARFDGLKEQLLNDYPFTPQSLVSLLFPYLTVKEEIFRTICVMNNLYMGVWVVVFLGVSLFRKFSRLEIVFILIAFFSLWASFGTDYHMRTWLAHLPLLDMFRFPAYFRPFVMIPVVLIALKTATLSMTKPNIRNLAARLGLVLFVGIFILTLISGYLGFKGGEINFSIIIQNIKHQEFVSYKLHLFVQGCIHLIIFGLGLLFISKLNKSWNKILFLMAFLADMVAATQLNIPFTVVNKNSPMVTQAFLENAEKGYPIPENVPMKEFYQKHVAQNTLYRNTSVFLKEPSFNTTNSFHLNNESLVSDSLVTFRDSLICNPLVYFPDQVKSLIELDKPSNTLRSKDVYFPDSVYQIIKTEENYVSPLDTLYISKFQPGEIRIVATTQGNRMVNLLHSYTDEWKLTVNEIPQKLYNTNINFMTFETLSGTHEYVLKYQAPLLKFSFWFVAGLFLVILIFIINLSFPRKKNWLKIRKF